MRLTQKWTAPTVLLCTVAFAVSANIASARPFHRHARAQAETVAADTADKDQRFPDRQQAEATAATPRGRHGKVAADATSVSIAGALGSGSLVSEARRYIGTNPTGRGSLWCGAFVDLVLKHTGHQGGGNLASGYKNYGTRVSGPQVGAIAVMGRKGGGHVGIVTGVDASGNPIILSGNHNHTVAESVYPASRIQAYVVPGS